MNLFRFFACCCSALTLAHAKTPPRVLILGDSVYRQPHGMIAKELSGKIELARSEIKSGEMLSSATALAHLEDLLGDGKWDLVIFNVGIGDLIHRAPDMKSFRLMPVNQGGVRDTNGKDYEANLNELVKRLKATRAKLVWASTSLFTTELGLAFWTDYEASE